MPKQTLIDPFNRRIKYVRLSVADKCNMRCFYCIPKGFKQFETPDNWLRFDETERIIAAFAELGVTHVRITGGEPLVRKNISQLVSRLSALNGIQDLSMSTNAALLAKHAVELKQAGLNRINVSLDSLQKQRFADITGNGKLDQVLAGLKAARDAGLAPIKINMVAMQGVNDDEYLDMVNYAIDNDFTLRLIETMPVGNTGRNASTHYHDLSEVKRLLAEKYELIPACMSGAGPAHYYTIAGSQVKIGFITPMSQHFCETCNRVRLTVDGTLHLCLGQENAVSLRPMLRAGISDQELKNFIIDAITHKPEKHEFREKPHQVVKFMSMTGG